MRKGQKMSEEVKKRISESEKGKFVSEETKKKIKENRKGIPSFRPNFHPDGFKGPHAEESKQKMSITKKKLFAEGKIKPWSYIDGLSGKRKRRMKRINGKYHLVSHLIWCSENVPYFVPKDFVIHHIDLNSDNNNAENLLMLPKGEHSRIHNAIIKELKKQEVSFWPS